MNPGGSSGVQTFIVEDLILSLAGALSAQVQENKAQSLEEVLLEQLHTTHDLEDWTVPISVAVDGVTPEQAKWSDSHGGHSIADSESAFREIAVMLDAHPEWRLRIECHTDNTRTKMANITLSARLSSVCLAD